MKILLNALRDAQDEHGHLSEETLRRISTDHDVPLAKLYGIASFYTMLKLEPQGRHRIELCSSPACMIHNAKLIEEAIEQELGISAGETSPDGAVSFYKSSCIGQCDNPPAMLLDGKPCVGLDADTIKTIIATLREAP